MPTNSQNCLKRDQLIQANLTQIPGVYQVYSRETRSPFPKTRSLHEKPENLGWASGCSMSLPS